MFMKMTYKYNNDINSDKKEKIEELLSDLKVYIDIKSTRVIFIGYEDYPSKEIFLKEISNDIQERLGINMYNFNFPSINSEYFATKKTYLTEIIDFFLEEDFPNENLQEKTIKDIENPINQLMEGLGDIINKTLPNISETTKVIKNLESDFKDINNQEQKSEERKPMKVQWDDDEDNLPKERLKWVSSGEVEEEEEEEEDRAEKVIELGENNEIDNEELQENIEGMVDMLQNSLGPMMGKLTEIFTGLSDQMKSLDGELESIENGIKKEDWHEIEENLNKNLEENEENISNIKQNINLSNELPFDLKEINPLSILKELTNSMQSEIENNTNSIKNTSNDQNIETNNKNPSSLTNNRANNKKIPSNPQENSDFIAKIVQKIRNITQTKSPLLLMLEDLDQAQELTFNIIEEILMNHRDIPLYILTTYSLAKDSARGSKKRAINNKYLRLLLAKFKIDKLGKIIEIRK
ncbi:MAG: hypothetical protein GY870_03805 [archaeon]|nr:hypothetical protein [archaeon]